jgi:hypothetical protein
MVCYEAPAKRLPQVSTVPRAPQTVLPPRMIYVYPSYARVGGRLSDAWWDGFSLFKAWRSHQGVGSPA